MARQRNRQASDATYNARRRFIRAANRWLDKSYDTVGNERTRYREMARDAALKAAELYQRKADIKRKTDFGRLATEFNINLSEFVTGKDLTKREQQQRETLIKQSEQVTATPPKGSTAQDRLELRREREAQAILSSPIGSRIYAGLVDVWAQPTIENGEIVQHRTADDINRAIMDYFGVNSMMDVIEILERQVDLYADPESLERYDAVSLSIMKGLYL